MVLLKLKKMNSVCWSAKSGFTDRIWGLNKAYLENDPFSVDLFWNKNSNNACDIEKYIDFPTQIIKSEQDITKYKKIYGDNWNYTIPCCLSKHLFFKKIVTDSVVDSYDYGIHLRLYDHFRNKSDIDWLLTKLINRGKSLIEDGKKIFLSTDSKHIFDEFKSIKNIFYIDPKFSGNFVNRGSNDGFLFDLQSFYNLTTCPIVYTSFGHFGKVASMWNNNKEINLINNVYLAIDARIDRSKIRDIINDNL